MLGVCLSKEYHDTLERFFGQFAVDENARTTTIDGKTWENVTILL
jgi:hypothetical protein